MAQKPPVDPALVDALLTLDDQFCFALHAASRVMVREDERELLVRVTAKGLALKQQACQVPLSLIQNSPISAAGAARPARSAQARTRSTGSPH